MNRITVVGAGAFGTALAVALATQNDGVTLWARNSEAAAEMQAERSNSRYLPGVIFPKGLSVSSEQDVLESAEIILLVVPTQKLRSFLEAYKSALSDKTFVVCCKGIEAKTGCLPSELARQVLPDCKVSVLTGPGFAGEIAAGMPTALTLAGGADAPELQVALSTSTLRLYLSDDPVGAQLGGALKNVIAIACGMIMGAKLGESARAALITRGYAEILKLATDMGAKRETLRGLSGFGDLALTCTSMQSRNYALGFDLGKGGSEQTGNTVEGVATAAAVVALAKSRGVEMPISQMVAAVLDRSLTIAEAMELLLSRPLKAES